jgi:hypothetical protein
MSSEARITIRLAIEADRPGLERFGRPFGVRHPALCRQPAERRKRRSGITARLDREKLQGFRGELDPAARAAIGVGEGPLKYDLQVLGAERLELIDLAPGDQRPVDLEVGVLGRRPDQGQGACLYCRQQGILLSLVEAMDLVEEEDGPSAALGQSLFRPRNHGPDLGPTGVDRRLLLEDTVEGRCDGPGDRGLAAAGRAVQDRAVGHSGLDRLPEGRVGSDQVLLADHLVQRPRPHPRREGRVRARFGRTPGSRYLALEKRVLSFLSHLRSHSKDDAGLGAVRCHATPDRTPRSQVPSESGRAAGIIGP